MAIGFLLISVLTMQDLISENACFAYGKHSVLENIDLVLQPGTLTALVGPNGAGKSTLLHLLQGHLKPRSGQIRLGERSVEQCRSQITVMPQRGSINWDFPITVSELVGLGQINRPLKSCCDRAAALQRVGLSDQANRRLDALSGGQQQRALLARSLVQSAQVLLLDEPCSALDPPARDQFLLLMRQLADAGLMVVVSSHDWGEALHSYDRVVVLDRKVLADGTPQQVRSTLGSFLAIGSDCRD